jgi:membrane fusion protein (multidrug efflux system)
VHRRVGRWRREHPRGALIALVVLALLVVGGALVWWHLHTHESTDDAQVDGHIAPISSRVAGTVTGVFVEDNQPVTAGELLVQLDPRDYDVALARAQAELAQARAQLAATSPNVPITQITNVTQIATTGSDVDTARAGIVAAERDHQSQLARVRSAEAADARAAADLTRYRYLLGQRAIPEERYDQIVATAKAARADVEAARALARAAQKSVEQQRLRLQQALSRHGEASRNAPSVMSIREASIEAQEAAVKAAEAAVERARLDLAYTKIVAPIAGIVGKRSVEPGQRVQPGEALVAIVDLDELWVTANFKETQLRRMRVGQPARIKVDALGVRLDGTVESFAGASGARYSLLPPENATGNYVKVVQRLPVRIRIAPNQDPHRRLRLGMSVEPNVALR